MEVVSLLPVTAGAEKRKKERKSAWPERALIDLLLIYF
jgi:hypothetical protein